MRCAEALVFDEAWKRALASAGVAGAGVLSGYVAHEQQRRSRSLPPTRTAADAVPLVLLLVHTALQYSLMLAVMTCRPELAAAALAGTTLGHGLFNLHFSGVAAGDACPRSRSVM